MWISEDATAITQKTEYDPNTRRVIGNTYRYNKSTGIPIITPSIVRSAKDVKSQAHCSQQATDLNVVMAVSLSPNAVPICLLVYGTGKSFNSEIYASRIRYISKVLAKLGIINMGTSTDGASPYQRGMKILSGLGSVVDETIPSEYAPYFACRGKEPPFCVQDTIHLGGKLKNRFLDVGKFHRIGKCDFLLLFLNFSFLSVNSNAIASS